MVNRFFFLFREKNFFLQSFKSYFEISLKRSNRLLLLSPSNYRVHNVPFFLVKGTGGEKFWYEANNVRFSRDSVSLPSWNRYGILKFIRRFRWTSYFLRSIIRDYTIFHFSRIIWKGEEEERSRLIWLIKHVGQLNSTATTPRHRLIYRVKFNSLSELLAMRLARTSLHTLYATFFT